MRGEIVTLLIATCGRCDSEPLRLGRVLTKTQAIRYMRNQGWRHTKRDGWICPECAETMGK